MTPRERLAFLAKKLREPLPEDLTFDIGAWRKERSCGTAACAVGYAALLPELAADGLVVPPNGYPRFRRHSGYDAASKFFGIPYGAALSFFNPDYYKGSIGRVTPDHVADRIDQWLAQNPETAP